MMRLAVRPKPAIGESMAGYVARISHANGYELLEPFFRGHFSEALSQFSDPGRLPLKTVMDATGHTLEDISNLWLTYERSPTGSAFKFRDVTIPTYLVHSGHPYCPICLEADGVWRASWRTGWMPVCLEHESELVVNGTHGVRQDQRILYAPSYRPSLVEDCIATRTPSQVCELAKVLDEELQQTEAIETWLTRFRCWLTTAYMSKRSTSSKARIGGKRLPRLIAYPLSPSETVEMYNQVLARGLYP